MNEYELTAVSTSVRHIYTLLRPIGFANRANVRISRDGISVAVEDSRVAQAHVQLDRELFSLYTYTSDECEFGISLTALLECLQIFVGERERAWTPSRPRETQHVLQIGATCRLRYEGTGSPLTIVLDEGGDMITTCELTTYEADEHADISFATDALLQRIIMKSEWLHDAMLEMDAFHADTLTFYTSPRRPYFRLSSSGPMGSTELEYPNDRKVLETFVCHTVSTNVYRFAVIKHALRAMAIAKKVSMRCDETGVLSLQFMVSLDEDKKSFIDFRVLSLDEQIYNDSE